jgi:hypothetical protein
VDVGPRKVTQMVTCSCLYFDDTVFESRPEYELIWLRFPCFFSDLPVKFWDGNLQGSYNHFLSHPFQLIIHRHQIIRRYISWVTDSVVKYVMNKQFKAQKKYGAWKLHYINFAEGDELWFLWSWQQYNAFALWAQWLSNCTAEALRNYSTWASVSLSSMKPEASLDIVNSLSLEPILSQLNPVFQMFNFIVIVHLCVSSWSGFSFRSSDSDLVLGCNSYIPCGGWTPLISVSPWLYHLIYI